VRLVLGNTELHLQGSYYRHAAPTGPGDFDAPETGERETRLAIGLNHSGTSSDTLDIETSTSVYPAPEGLDHSDIIAAGYAQQTWVATPELHFNAGARVDSDPRFDPVVTPRIAASWNAWLNVLSFGSEPDYVPRGIVLGVDLVSGRPKLLGRVPGVRA
jgi:outer membrane receptor protein involved in Fe transport